jgi:hypothetical protein
LTGRAARARALDVGRGRIRVECVRRFGQVHRFDPSTSPAPRRTARSSRVDAPRAVPSVAVSAWGSASRRHSTRPRAPASLGGRVRPNDFRMRPRRDEGGHI